MLAADLREVLFCCSVWVLVRLTYRKIEKSRQRLRENDDSTTTTKITATWPAWGLRKLDWNIVEVIGKGLLLRFAKSWKRYFDNENKYGRTWLVRYFQIVIFLLVEEVLVCWWSSSSTDFFRCSHVFDSFVAILFVFWNVCFFFWVAPEMTSLGPASMSSWEGNHMSFFPFLLR